MTRSREICRQWGVLDADEKKEIRAALAEYLAIKKRLVEIDEQSLALYDERDQLTEQGADLAPNALSRRYGVSSGTIKSLIKRRQY